MLVLLATFDALYVLVVVVTIGLYVWFTFAVTEWRVKIRKVMNDQDTDANQKAIDSLLNFETVKYFGAERWEADRYDAAMKRYEAAAVKTNYSLAFLNFGQSLIITSGLVAHAVELSWHCLSRDPSGADRHGRYVRFVRATRRSDR